MTKLAIIGASYLQEPLIQKAKERGIETHVFAWLTNDVGEKSADYFYPISIIEKEEILRKCKEIGIDGICSISSDLAVTTVNYVAEMMGLTGNSILCAEVSTNKHRMRECFRQNGDPSPKSCRVESVEDLEGVDLAYPVIVKPVDRSGSRGVTEVYSREFLSDAIIQAKEQGFEKCALVEEFVKGQEYSVEFISWEGNHEFLALTKKYTTGSPNFIERGHLEPAPIDAELLENIKRIVSHALDSLGIRYGASHSELKVLEDGTVKIIEIGARMGGDCIGSSLVQLSTGYDFVDAVIDVALGNSPKSKAEGGMFAAVRFVFSQEDVDVLNRIQAENPQILVEKDVREISDIAVTDSSSRFGYYIIADEGLETIEQYLPDGSGF